MATYSEKLITVQAFQWVAGQPPPAGVNVDVSGANDGTVNTAISGTILTDNGLQTIQPGMWVITTVTGNTLVLDNGNFNLLYQFVSNP